MHGAAARPNIPILMSRKPKKGYYVRGEFVAEGSELDVELKAELKGTTDRSRTDLKRESTELQKLGEDLLLLRGDLLARLDLSEKLADAVEQVRKITNFEGRRRQMQFIGKLMRRMDPETLQAVRDAMAEQKGGAAADTLSLHLAEQWRNRLIAEDPAVGEWISTYPDTDSQQLRALVRQARKDAVPEKPGLAPRHGRAYRDIFRLVRQTLSGGTADDDSDDRDDSDEDND